VFVQYGDGLLFILFASEMDLELTAFASIGLVGFE
jgi:hypothetical protein